MSSKRLSPTAKVLRSSRMFSLPPPLPRPDSDTHYMNNSRSDTATTQRPSQAALATPKSSLVRGDWGLKRPLPLRSTARTTTPTVRVKAVDNFEQVTDFESAADHVITLKKWQEYNLPLARPTSDRRWSGSGLRDGKMQTGFEGDYDTTDSRGRDALEPGTRWKHEGPWLAGKTKKQFDSYVQTQIRQRRGEFSGHLRHLASEKKAATRRRIAVERGETLPQSEAESSSISDAELRQYVLTLRNDTNRLNEVVQSFLDLPAISSSSDSDEFSLMSHSASMSADTEPPATHPSAGLSYLRTSSHIANHPILGPQEHHAPVLARVLTPPFTNNGRRNAAKFGIGGIVAEGQLLFNSRMEAREPGVSTFDPKVQGGGKIWVHPLFAEVDAGGRIKLSIDKASDNTIAIYDPDYDSSKLPAPASTKPASSSRNSRADLGVGIEHSLPSDAELRNYITESKNMLREQIR